MASRVFNVDTSDLELIIGALVVCRNEMLSVDTAKIDKLVKKCKNNLKTIKISSRKGKGRGLQQEVCRDISEITDIPYDQGDDNCLIHSREMGLSGLDVILRGEALQKFPFSVECKCSEGLNIKDTYEQVKGNALPKTDWLIVHKRKSIPEIIVMLSWDAFKKILKERQ
jgi:hypothetical protein